MLEVKPRWLLPPLPLFLLLLLCLLCLSFLFSSASSFPPLFLQSLILFFLDAPPLLICSLFALSHFFPSPFSSCSSFFSFLFSPTLLLSLSALPSLLFLLLNSPPPPLQSVSSFYCFHLPCIYSPQTVFLSSSLPS